MSTEHSQALEDPEALQVCPRLADDVTVHSPSGPDEPWVIEKGGRRYFRVSEQIARFAQLLNGQNTSVQLMSRLGEGWDQPVLAEQLRRFDGLQLLHRPGEKPFADRRLVFVRPMSLQLRVMDPSRVQAVVRPMAQAASGRLGRVLFLGIVSAGIITLALEHDAVRSALSAPVGLTTFFVVIAATWAATVLHEFGHFALLSAYGGTSRRVGVMLFYGLPAFFCDVSDAWRLPGRMKRVAICLAGVAVQGFIAGACALSIPFLDDSSTRTAVILVSLSVYLSTLINFVPFLKFDGYLALMSWVDIPNLRDRAMVAGRRYLAALLFGGKTRDSLPPTTLALFGLASMIAPLLLLAGIAFPIWMQAVGGIGWAGALLTLTFILVMLGLLGRGGWRIISIAIREGASRMRIVVVSSVLLVGVAVVLAVVRVPLTVEGSYRTTADGRLQLLMSPDADRGHVRTGDRVVLKTDGLVLALDAGSAKVRSIENSLRPVLVSDLTPIEINSSVTIPYHVYELEVTDRPAAGRGGATVDLGDRPLGAWLVEKYLVPVYAVVGG